MIEPFDQDILWIIVVGFIVAFVLAFGIGANDVANSFGTSVGSKVLTLRQACIVASIFELAGAVLIGARVSDTVRKGIIDITNFNGIERLAMAGALSALTGASIWLLVATFFRLPVSGTHSIVGATMGYALVQHGLSGVHWKKFGTIAASWVVSPVLSGIMSSIIFLIIKYTILQKDDAFKVGLKSLPLFYFFTAAIILFSIFYKGSHYSCSLQIYSNKDVKLRDQTQNNNIMIRCQMLRFNEIPLYGVLIISFGGAILLGLLIQFVIAPWLKNKILKEVSESSEPSKQPLELDDIHVSVKKKKNWKKSESCDKKETVVFLNDSGISVSPCKDNQPFVKRSPGSSSEELNVKASDHKTDLPTTPPEKNWKEEVGTCLLEKGTLSKETTRAMTREMIADEPKIGRLFKFLQILTASFGAFAHGGNDVSNAIAPVISLWVIYRTGYIAPKVDTPIWILFYGGVGIIIGLCVWGRRVIKTLGEDLTPITPSSGFSIEIGAALTVLLASNLGIPVSTTHCKVGSVVMVGRVRSKSVVDWSLFKNIVLSWIITMPCAGALAAAVYAVLRELI